MTTTEVSTYVDVAPAELEARRAATSLRNRLRLNTGFSILSGVVFVALAAPIAELLGVEDVWAVRSIGIALVPFALVVFLLAGASTPKLIRWSSEVSIADFGWVAGTAVVVGLGWLSTAGVILMGAVAAVVFGLGVAQLRARRRTIDAMAATSATLDESPPVEVHVFERVVRGTPDELWPAISDHALYAELALNLKAAENLTPNGPGFERSCTDTAGRRWSEKCTLWEPGRRFDVDVNIDDYPYPLETMQGSWRVDPLDATRSRVGMVFAFQPDPGIAGRLFSPVMHVLLPPILKRIAKGWEARRGPHTSRSAPERR